MITTILDAVEGEIATHTGNLCAVTSSQHHAANTLASNRPVIALGDPEVEVEGEYIGGDMDLDLKIEIWIIHPYTEETGLARAFFSEAFPILAFLGAEKFEPVHVPIQGVNYPAYRTHLTRTHNIEG